MATLVATKHDPSLRCKPDRLSGENLSLHESDVNSAKVAVFPTTLVVRLRRDPSQSATLKITFVPSLLSPALVLPILRTLAQLVAVMERCRSEFPRTSFWLKENAARYTCSASISAAAWCSEFARRDVFRETPYSSTISPAPIGSKRRPWRKC